ncbi:MAG: hypothetical protein WKG03_16290 [Telluria sp.]
MELFLLTLAVAGGAGAVVFVTHGLSEAQDRLDMLRSLRRRDRR